MSERDFKVKNGIEFGGNLTSNTSGFSFDYTTNTLTIAGSAIALQANVDSVSSNVASNFTTLNSSINTVNSNVESISGNVSGLQTDINTVSSNVNTLTNNFTDFTSYANSTFTTNAHIDTKIAALVDSAPGALDTLNELAAALGDDPNFATTITNTLNTISSNVDVVSSDLSNLISDVDTVTDNVNTVSSNVSSLIAGNIAFTGEVDFNNGITSPNIVINSVANSTASIATSIGTATTTVFTFPGAQYRGAELTLLVQDITNSEYQLSKLLVVHDGNSVVTTEYGILHTGSIVLNSFSAAIDAGDVITIASNGGSANKKISVVSSLLIQ